MWSHPLGRFPRDAAGDGSRRQVELVRDRLVALVPCEEAVEDLLAVLRQAGESLVHRERLVDPRQRVVEARRLQVLSGRLLARPGAEVVDAEAARELGEPGADGLVFPQ